MHILVCCQDIKYRSHLIQIIQKLDCKEVITIESSTTFPLKPRKYDIAFLDIRIDEHKAFEVGKGLFTLNQCIIFYMYDDYTYVHDFFKAEGFQYLLKHHDQLIENELERAYQRYLDIHCQIVVKNGKNIWSLKPDDILYIEELKHSVKVVKEECCYQGIIEDYEKMKEHLKKHYFVQVHPHYFVNARYIMEYKSHEIIMKNSDFLPSILRNSDILKMVVMTF